MRPLSEAPYLDLFDPEFQANPEPYVAALRQDSNVLRTPLGASIIDRSGADGFDPTADREPHVGFGGGPHHCLGANLARAEMQEALPLLAAAMPAVKVAEPPQWRSPLGGIAGPLKLHLAFTPKV